MVGRLLGSMDKVENPKKTNSALLKFKRVHFSLFGDGPIQKLDKLLVEGYIALPISLCRGKREVSYVTLPQSMVFDDFWLMPCTAHRNVELPPELRGVDVRIRRDLACNLLKKAGVIIMKSLPGSI